MSTKPFSSREKDVLHLLSQGLSNQEIAEKLNLVPGTISWYIKSIKAKLCSSKHSKWKRADLIEYAKAHMAEMAS